MPASKRTPETGVNPWGAQYVLQKVRDRAAFAL